MAILSKNTTIGGYAPILNDGTIDDKLKHILEKKISIGDTGNVSFNGDTHVVGTIKETGTYECTNIDETTNKYTFAVSDTSVFTNSTEYCITIEEIDYIVRTTKLNADNILVVAVNEPVPVIVGNSYDIVFKTANATVFGKGNTVLAHNALGAGYNNKIYETADQSVTFGYGHEIWGKNQLAVGYNHDILGGEANLVTGSSNILNGRNKFVSGTGLTSVLTSDGSIVFGKHNVDVENALLIIGGGFDKNQKNNLLVMHRYGETDLNSNLNVNGDIVLDGNFSINGLTREVGEFECTRVYKSTDNYYMYTFKTGNRTHVFEYSHEKNCKITINDVDYDVLIGRVDYEFDDTVDDNNYHNSTTMFSSYVELPFIVGDIYKIRIETKDDKSLSFVKNNTTSVFDMNFTGDALFKGSMLVNDSSVVTNASIQSYSGIDVGCTGRGLNSSMFGSYSQDASGLNSFVAGAGNVVSNDQGVVFGYSNENYAKNALISGLNNIIEDIAESSVALGRNIHIYSSGAGIGHNLTVNGVRTQIVLGRYNKEETDALFIVGNGTTTDKLNNAFTIHNNGNSKFIGNVTIDKDLSAYTINTDYLNTKYTVNAKDINASNSIQSANIISKGSISAEGTIKGSNIFPITKLFTVNGNIVNADTGEIVAEYNDGKVNFKIVSVSYGNGYDGVMIKNNKSLIVPIIPITIKPGTYKKEIPCPGKFRLDECDFKVSWTDGNTENVVDKGDYYLVTKDIVVDTVYLKTNIADSDIPYNGTYRFTGSGVLSFDATMVTDITADLIGATTEYTESDGISTSLRLTSPDGTVYKLTVDNNGTLITTKI